MENQIADGKRTEARQRFVVEDALVEGRQRLEDLLGVVFGNGRRIAVEEPDPRVDDPVFIDRREVRVAGPERDHHGMRFRLALAGRMAGDRLVGGHAIGQDAEAGPEPDGRLGHRQHPQQQPGTGQEPPGGRLPPGRQHGGQDGQRDGQQRWHQAEDFGRLADHCELGQQAAGGFERQPVKGAFRSERQQQGRDEE